MPTAIKTQSSLCSLFSFGYRFCVTMANKSKQDAINKLTPLFFFLLLLLQLAYTDKLIYVHIHV